MKRSEINALIKKSEAFIASFQFALPPFCNWSPEDWKTKGHECDEIRDNMLGWDITDYGLGKFEKYGMILITIRNGNQNNPKYTKPYAEKLLISEEEQVCTMHFHWNKQEDIINRGGGILCMQLYNSTADEELDKINDVHFVSDGVEKSIPAGTILELAPGESITLMPGIYHSFQAKKGCGKCLIGEVSKCNDDNADNRFLEKMERFSTIEEDVPIYRYLCNEYPAAK